MKERLFCQSCGMPLDRAEDMGTEADGAPSGEYCRYCYQAGAFTAPEATMGTRAEAEQMMRSWYPTLKRWRQG